MTEPTPSEVVDRERMLQSLSLIPGQTMTFVVNRTPEAIARDGRSRTFSQEAIDQLSWQVMAWVGSRVGIAKQAKTLPQQVEVTVTVKFPENEESA